MLHNYTKNTHMRKNSKISNCNVWQQLWQIWRFCGGERRSINKKKNASQQIPFNRRLTSYLPFFHHCKRQGSPYICHIRNWGDSWGHKPLRGAYMHGNDFGGCGIHSKRITISICVGDSMGIDGFWGWQRYHAFGPYAVHKIPIN